MFFFPFLLSLFRYPFQREPILMMRCGNSTLGRKSHENRRWRLVDWALLPISASLLNCCLEPISALCLCDVLWCDLLGREMWRTICSLNCLFTGCALISVNFSVDWLQVTSLLHRWWLYIDLSFRSKRLEMYDVLPFRCPFGQE